MPRRSGRLQGLSIAARWPAGIAWTSWQYMWRTTPVHRWEMAGSSAEDAVPALPAHADRTDVQDAQDGVGPLFHRVYRTSIRGSGLDAHELMAKITADLDALAPSGMARFQRVAGGSGSLEVGDAYVVRMPGPWDGPVRVVAVSPVSFRLATLDGHLEAGQIEFRAHFSSRSIEFVIESWARSGDRLSDLLYAHLRMAKEVQLYMWTAVLTHVAELAGGHMHGGIRVVTRRVDADELGQTLGPASDRALAALRGLPVNFDPPRSWDHAADEGWHVDDMSADLPGEPSGEPAEGGSWQIARRLMNDYQVADPGKVRAVFDRHAPLQDRDMLLQIRFLFLRMNVGVRVGTPYDEIRTVDGHQVRVFGWSYRTLQGHFEQGEMHYQVWKWLQDGHVEFRLQACSRAATDGPRWMRLGFRLVGRRQQLAYYRSACRRMRRLTESQLDVDDVRRREAQSPPP